MYYTYKDTQAIRNTVSSRQNTVTNLIDNLFSGTEITAEQFNEINTDTHVGLVRTKTSKRPSIHVDRRVLGDAMTIKSIIDSNPHPQNQYYTFKIPKRSGGLRTINAPEETLMKQMRTINNILVYNMKVLAHDSAWAYVKGRDVVGAMKEHTNNKSNWFLKADLKDFFGSCSTEFIVKQLKQVHPFSFIEGTIPGFCQSLAEYSVLDGGLPQGTPLSPLLTNIIMTPIDFEINRLLNLLVQDELIPKQRYVYTRYADDIIISAKLRFDHELVMRAIKDVTFKETPLQFNETKTRFATSSGRNWNLGVMCNNNNETTVGYRKKKVLKTMAHNYFMDKANDIKWSVEDLQHFQGLLAWLEHVEPTYYTGFTQYLHNKYSYDLKESILTDIRLG